MPDTNGSNQQREKVSFAHNVPTLVGLEFDDGQPVAGRFGDQYQYFLSDNRIMWVDPRVRDLIVESGARAGDQVVICKREIRTGARKRVQWEVERFAGDLAETDPLPPAKETEPRAPQKAAPPPGSHQPAAETRGNNVQPQATTGGDALAVCLLEALDAAHQAENAAAEAGRPLLFASGDIRALAVTLFIQRRSR